MEDFQIKKLKTLIKQEYGYNVDNKTRKREIVETRALYYTILKNFSNLSLSAIARTVKKNHATVLHGINNFDNWKMHNKYLDIAYHTIVSKLNDLDSVDEIRENKELRRQLIQLKLENQKLKNVEQNKDSLQELIKNLPKDKIEDIKERVKIMIDAYEWKSKDKITVYECNGTTISWKKKNKPNCKEYITVKKQ